MTRMTSPTPEHSSASTPRRRRIGPGMMVAAAFIGPGTVTTCTLAGANFGYALIWALAFATLATAILQEMAVRLGVGARLGLGQALVQLSPSPVVTALWAGLVIGALVIGNSAYQAGNLSGAMLGAQALLPPDAADRRILVVGITLLAGAALVIGRYAVLEKILIGLVFAMSLAFIASAVLIRPDLSALIAGFVPTLPPEGILTVIGLIGTTIVPYNLFLHAAAAREKWVSADDLPAARGESTIAIGLGGLVSILILTTAAGSLFTLGVGVTNSADMARALEPTFGAAAPVLIGGGLLAAGLTSALTAPMATAYAVTEMLGPQRARQIGGFRMIALAVLVVGAAIALMDIRPVQMIVIAQAANGLLLPVIAVFLLMVMNSRTLLGDYRNGLTANILGGLVVIIAIGLGTRMFLRIFGWMP